jgi:hypothetical protein
MNGIGMIFGELDFGGVIQRRGTDVSTPKNGSRGAEIVFGGI